MIKGGGDYNLNSLRFSAKQTHKLLSNLCRFEDTTVCTCRGDAVLFLYAAHLHAHVFGLDHDHDALRFERLLNAVLDLLGQSFLHLKTVTEDVYHASHLA